MRLFLDTTIQIDRIFGSKKKKAAIRAACAGHHCCCTSYVLGEFYATIVQDAVNIYHILLSEDNLDEAEKRVAELARNRHSQRMHLIFIQLRELYQNDLEEIKCECQSYLEDLIYMFHRGLAEDISDTTGCQRGKACVEYEDEIPYLTGVNCRKDTCVCQIEEFWRDHLPLLAGVPLPEDLEDEVRLLLEQIQAGQYPVKGNQCRTLGDSVITAEAKSGDGAVCTTNQKDYRPLCELFRVQMCCPDYSAVYRP